MYASQCRKFHLKSQNLNFWCRNQFFLRGQMKYIQGIEKHLKAIVFWHFLGLFLRGQPKSWTLYAQRHYAQASGINPRIEIHQILIFFLFSKQMQAQLKVQSCIDLQQELGGEGRSIGCWSVHQNLLYSIFVDQNKSFVISKKKRKKMRIFDMMSKFIGSRNSLQCRSHHQKFVQKFGDIKQIVGAFKNFFGNQCYREYYRVYTGKKARCLQGMRSLLVKNQQKQPLGYQPSISEEKQGQIVSNQLPQEQPGEKVRVDDVDCAQKKDAKMWVCKTEQSIQFYRTYSYYIGNNFLPYTFFFKLYALPNTQ